MGKYRLLLVGLAVLLVSVAAACGGGSDQEARNPDFVQLPPAAPAGQWVLFGHIIVDEGHRLLTFVVAPKARVTILVDAGWQTKITVSELVQLLGGKNPRHRPLMGDSRPFGERFGFWIRAGHKYPNPALSVDQQYQP